MDDKETVLKELEELEQELAKVKTRSKLAFPYLGVGVMFFILFLLTIFSSQKLIQLIGVVSFIVSLASLLKVASDILYTKSWSTHGVLIFAASVFFVGIGAMILWTNVLSSMALLIYGLLFIIFLIELAFFIIHAYIAYLNRHSKYELQVTAFIALMTLIIAIATYIYAHVVLYLLFIIAIVIFTKALIDLSTRFRSKK